MNRRLARLGRTAAIAAAAVVLLGGAAASVVGPLFLVDDRREPEVRVSWPTRNGAKVELEGSRKYRAAEDRTPLGNNLAVYAALGGTRLEVGASDPGGAIVKVGFYKIDGKKWLFEDIAPGGAVTIEISGVKFNRPGTPRPATLVHHAKFDDPNSLLGCVASAAAATRDNLVDLFNTADASDTLNGRITARNGRLGVIRIEGEGSESEGSAKFTVEADGTISATVTIPYALFKHPDDPWLRSTPGDFAEPFHFHLEFEVVPNDGAGKAAGAGG
jgi:hypothetical protein